MLDILVIVALVLSALIWAWLGVDNIRRKSLVGAQPAIGEATPRGQRLSLLGAAVCAATGVALIDRADVAPEQRGVMAAESDTPEAPPEGYAYSGGIAPPWWAAYPDGLPPAELEMTDELPVLGEHADGLDWKPLGQ